MNPLTGDTYQQDNRMLYPVDNSLLPGFDSKLLFWHAPARYSPPRNIKLGMSLRW